MKISFTYHFGAAHWNDGYGGTDVRKLPLDEFYKSIHGHNWRVRIDVEGHRDSESGLIMDEVVIRKCVMQFNNTFLPEHPAVKRYDVTPYRGGTECMVYVILRELRDLAPEGVTSISAEVWETPDISSSDSFTMFR